MFIKGDFAAPALKIPDALEAGFCKKGLLEVLALDFMNGFEAATAGASVATDYLGYSGSSFFSLVVLNAIGTSFTGCALD